MNRLRKRLAAVMTDEWINEHTRAATMLMMACGLLGCGSIGIASATAARIRESWIALPLIGFMALAFLGWLGYVWFTLTWVNGVIKRAEKDHRNQGELIASMTKLRVGELAYWSFVVSELPADHPAREVFLKMTSIYYDGMNAADLVNLHLSHMREFQEKKTQE